MKTRPIAEQPASATRFRLLPWSPAGPAVQALSIVSAWLATGLVALLFRFRSDTASSLDAAWSEVSGKATALVPCFAPWVLATPILARTVSRLPLHGPRRWWHAAAHGALAVPVIYAVVLTEAGLRALGGMPALSTSALTVSPIGFLLQLVVYAGAIGVLEALSRSAHARQREQELADLRARRLELENDLRDAQLEALRAKLSPHFLFNALQSVTALMRVDPDAAEGMLSRLGDVLRMALRLDLTQEIPLDEELKVARAYLELEQVRFRDRLSVTIDVDDDVRDALVPSLILQPVVENGVRHGVSVARRRAELLIDARRVEGDLMIGVRDNGPGFGAGGDDASVLGVGLGVLRSRLEKLYRGEAVCRCGNRPGGGAIVEIRLPFHSSPRQTEDLQ